MRALTTTLALALLAAGSAWAKLPAPSDEAKAAAAVTASKNAWNDKVGGYQLCQSMNRVAEHYRKTAKAEGRTAAAPVDTPACADPGAFVPPVAASAPPLEAAGAHSPAKTAVAPPSGKATAAEQQGQPKK